MRLIATVLMILGFCAGRVGAQCDLSTSASPKLANLSLGMTVSEVNAALNGAAKVRAKKGERTSFFKNYLKKNGKGVLSGAKAFYVRFYQQRAYQIEMFYHRDYRWSDLQGFLRDYSAASGFPYEYFVFKNGYAAAKCDGFSVTADYVLNPHIEITDEAVREQIKNKK